MTNLELKLWLRQKKLTRKQFAAYCGISWQSVSVYVTGTRYVHGEQSRSVAVPKLIELACRSYSEQADGYLIRHI